MSMHVYKYLYTCVCLCSYVYIVYNRDSAHDIHVHVYIYLYAMIGIRGAKKAAETCVSVTLTGLRVTLTERVLRGLMPQPREAIQRCTPWGLGVRVQGSGFKV
jgi:hypothetical protein